MRHYLFQRKIELAEIKIRLEEAIVSRDPAEVKMMLEEVS